MIDLPDVLMERLQELGYEDAQYKRLADADDGGIVVRGLPATIRARYYNGPVDMQFLVQVIAVRESEEEAQTIIDNIAWTVPDLDLSSKNGSYSLTSVDIYSTPTETRPPERGYYTWDVVFEASITTKGQSNG